ncbi:DNRLRE domain-containing protein [bacterium]|nr:DNRLRE domain-containing protein [bacterium]
MNYQKRLCILLCTLMLSGLAVYSCEESNEPVNNAPDEPLIIVQDSDHEFLGGESVDIWATVSDPDGDEMTVTWTATGGYFSTTSSRHTTWTAPTVTAVQQFTITLRVQDNQGASNSKSVNLTVNPPVVDPPDEPTEITIDTFADTYVSSMAPSTINGSEYSIYTGTVNFGGAGDAEFWGYTKFTLYEIPSTANILEARLYMRVGYNSAPDKPVGTTAIYMINDHNWTESTLNYTNRPVSMSLIASHQVTFGVAAYTSWDVTSAVRNWVNYGSSNYGFAIRTTNIDIGGYCAFYSKEYTGGSNYLYVRYEE